MHSLEENISNDLGPNGAPASDEFRVCDESSANWVVRKVVEARAYAERVKRWADHEIRRAEQDEERLMYLFGSQLHAWVASEVARFGGRRKSLNLPAGRVGFKKLGMKLVIEDIQAVLQWAKTACPAAVIVKERLDKALLDDHVRRTGALPDHGVSIRPTCDLFFIR